MMAARNQENDMDMKHQIFAAMSPQCAEAPQT